MALAGGVILFVSLPLSSTPYGDNSYGTTDPFMYLTGRFDPYRHPLFVKLTAAGIPCRGDHHILREEAARALKLLYDDFIREHPKAPFWVQSSTRNFESQRVIWEKKWRRLGEERRFRTDPKARGLSILTYSSMPGTSRHHWGTEVDLNVLRNDYFERGEGRVLYQWLLKNAHRYGFCQPYGAGRNEGYSEERWHWSYMPLSRDFLAHWNRLYDGNGGFFVRKGLFSGSEQLGVLAPVYVNGISECCR
ncbi:MAG: M15 family metallopeptidase [Spirochaetes bacterium]|nr:M15 family metallopeptidase [Spirochaetota bacterium]